MGSLRRRVSAIIQRTLMSHGLRAEVAAFPRKSLAVGISLQRAALPTGTVADRSSKTCPLSAGGYVQSTLVYRRTVGPKRTALFSHVMLKCAKMIGDSQQSRILKGFQLRTSPATAGFQSAHANESTKFGAVSMTNIYFCGSQKQSENRIYNLNVLKLE